jgi:hypothetical protein
MSLFLLVSYDNLKKTGTISNYPDSYLFEPSEVLMGTLPVRKGGSSWQPIACRFFSHPSFSSLFSIWNCVSREFIWEQPPWTALCSDYGSETWRIAAEISADMANYHLIMGIAL